MLGFGVAAELLTVQKLHRPPSNIYSTLYREPEHTSLCICVRTFTGIIILSGFFSLYARY
jgi:hypothetical protein